MTYEAPDEAVEQAKEFLTSVFEDVEGAAVDDRLDALKLMRKAEARKITQKTVNMSEADNKARRELMREIDIAERRLKLVHAGLWEDAPASWADDLLGDDYEPPPPVEAAEPPKGLAEALRNARVAHMRKVSAKSGQQE